MGNTETNPLFVVGTDKTNGVTRTWWAVFTNNTVQTWCTVLTESRSTNRAAGLAAEFADYYNAHDVDCLVT